MFAVCACFVLGIEIEGGNFVTIRETFDGCSIMIEGHNFPLT